MEGKIFSILRHTVNRTKACTPNLTTELLNLLNSGAIAVELLVALQLIAQASRLADFLKVPLTEAALGHALCI